MTSSPGCRTIAEHRPPGCPGAAWAWIERLGAGLPGRRRRDRPGATVRRGQPPRWTGRRTACWSAGPHPTPTSTARGEQYTSPPEAAPNGSGLMPWLGKKFDRSAQRGTNSGHRHRRDCTRQIAGTELPAAPSRATTGRVSRCSTGSRPASSRGHPGAGAGLRDHRHQSVAHQPGARRGGTDRARRLPGCQTLAPGQRIPPIGLLGGQITDRA